MDKSNYCGNCKHFEKTDDQYGKCHRFPPTRNNKGGIGSVPSVYPTVQATRDYCGEYQPRK